MNGNIFVAAGEAQVCTELRTALEAAGHNVTCAGTVCDLNRMLRYNKPSLVLLAAELPDGCGLEVCRRIRAGLELATIPVIMLGAKNDRAEMEHAFRAGCNAYLRSPLPAEEALLWCTTLLRGHGPGGGARAVVSAELEIYPEAGLVRFEGEAIPGLTSREIALLAALVRNAPRILPRARIVSEVWRTAAVNTLVGVHLFNLRKKLPARLAERIQSIPGRGLRFFKT